MGCAAIKACSALAGVQVVVREAERLKTYLHFNSLPGLNGKKMAPKQSHASADLKKFYSEFLVTFLSHCMPTLVESLRHKRRKRERSEI